MLMERVGFSLIIEEQEELDLSAKADPNEAPLDFHSRVLLTSSLPRTERRKT